MSNLIDPKTGSNGTPSKGLEQNRSTGEELRMDANVASDGSEEGEIQDDHATNAVGTKRKRSPSTEETGPSKKIKGPEPTFLSFKTMRHPTETIPCVISINEREPFGSLYPTNHTLTTRLFLDPGRFGPPSVALTFTKTGSETGRGIAKNVWDMLSNSRGEWAMNDVQHGYATPDGPDLRMSNRTVLADCSRRDIQNLMYLRFKSWSQVSGFHKKEEFSQESAEIKNSIKTMFRRQKAYQLELWFIAPFDAPDFRRHCLRYVFHRELGKQTTPFRPLARFPRGSFQPKVGATAATDLGCSLEPIALASCPKTRIIADAHKTKQLAEYNTSRRPCRAVCSRATANPHISAASGKFDLHGSAGWQDIRSFDISAARDPPDSRNVGNADISSRTSSPIRLRPTNQYVWLLLRSRGTHIHTITHQQSEAGVCA
ncbi:hypothetical protein HO173_009825 [Letharia columbiana]|uniref:Uncharacterized protein n=1 Tax=Letharia columbiana TaxID=112416 RepID=A0A8H6FNT9_9LECA|nr:uncharacterized protein HO173_009825 [Letharia columbiana]KAF6231988.1 hypothetical protein HO173_009825 [Letharia columbiana]